jgi:hypothetical protein
VEANGLAMSIELFFQVTMGTIALVGIGIAIFQLQSIRKAQQDAAIAQQSTAFAQIAQVDRSSAHGDAVFALWYAFREYITKNPSRNSRDFGSVFVVEREKNGTPERELDHHRRLVHKYFLHIAMMYRRGFISREAIKEIVFDSQVVTIFAILWPIEAAGMKAYPETRVHFEVWRDLYPEVWEHCESQYDLRYLQKNE